MTADGAAPTAAGIGTEALRKAVAPESRPSGAEIETFDLEPRNRPQSPKDARTSRPNEDSRISSAQDQRAKAELSGSRTALCDSRG